MTIVSHGFELANRAGTRANGVHVRRFEGLCADARASARDALPTAQFRRSSALRARPRRRAARPQPCCARGWRQAEQLWSNLVEERAA